MKIKLDFREKVPGPWKDLQGVTAKTKDGYFDKDGIWVDREEDKEVIPKGFIPRNRRTSHKSNTNDNEAKKDKDSNNNVPLKTFKSPQKEVKVFESSKEKKSETKSVKKQGYEDFIMDMYKTKLQRKGFDISQYESSARLSSNKKQKQKQKQK